MCKGCLLYTSWDPRRLAGRIAQAAREREVGTLVLGLPKNMDGSEGPRAEKCRDFKALLEAESGLPVVLWDERRSSIEAHAILLSLIHISTKQRAQGRPKAGRRSCAKLSFWSWTAC